MNMKKIMVLCLVLVTLVPTALWSTEMDKDLKDLIPIIKERVQLPKELTEFSYDMRSQGEGKEDIYALYWSDKEGKVGSLQVTAERNGNIISYSKNMYQSKYTILAKISYEEGLKVAKDFLVKIKAPYANALKLTQETKRTQSEDYVYQFDEYIKGVKVLDRKVRISVDKNTGEVKYFNGLETYKGSYGNEVPSISLDRAKEAYINKIGISLAYNLYYDYQNKSVKSFPLYLTQNDERKGIDAKMGEVITPLREDVMYYNGDKMAQTEAAVKYETGGGLTPQEQAVVDEVKGLMTKEEAKAQAEKYFPRIKGVSISNASLFKNDYEDQYIWSLAMKQTDATKKVAVAEVSMNDINVTVDAKTGDVLSYYFYSNDQEGETSTQMKLSEDKVKEKVEAFLKQVAKDKYAYIKYQETKQALDPRPLSAENPYANYYYVRMANGIPVNGNGLYVTYDALRDEVTGYSTSWNQVHFKAVTNVKDKVAIVDQLGLELMYISKDADHKVLAYVHEERNMAFDPFTGERVNSYDGKPVEKTQSVFYEDVKGHSKEAIIKKLYDSGIMLPGKRFKPDAQINQLDFLRLVMRISDESLSDSKIYDWAIEQGILSNKEKDKTLLINREQAVKYIISSTQYKDIATITDIYDYPFEDEAEISKELKGYITLAYGLGIIGKDNTNLFNPKEKVTRAEAAEMIYNLMVKESK